MASSSGGGRSKLSGARLRGRADLERLRRMTEREVADSSPAELADLPDDFWDDAEVVTPVPKEPISLRVDQDVLDSFRERGPGYQTRMNAVLRSYMTAVSARDDDRDTMRPEYDFSKGVRGATAARYREGANVVVVDPSLVDVFADSEAVNEALRALAPVIRRARGE